MGLVELLLIIPAFCGSIFAGYLLLNGAEVSNPFLFLIPDLLRIPRRKIQALLRLKAGSPMGLSFPLIFLTYYLLVLALPAVPRELLLWIVRILSIAAFAQSLLILIEIRTQERRRLAVWMRRRLEAITDGGEFLPPRFVREKYPIIYIHHMINSLLAVVLWNISLANFH